MRKFIVFILAIGMIAGLSSAAFAVPGSVTVDSNNDGGKNYLNGFSQSFDAGSYTFTVADGGWGDWWGAEGWFWSLNIYNENTTYNLGDNTSSYGSASDALAAYSGNSVTIDLASSGDIWFYVQDSSGWNNYGAVTVDVAVAEGPPIVPEPISSILFIAGGMVLTGRRYLKRKKRTNTEI